MVLLDMRMVQGAHFVIRTVLQSGHMMASESDHTGALIVLADRVLGGRGTTVKLL